MDAKEIKTIINSLDKSSNDDTTILRLLNILDKNVKPSEKLLRDTKVGVSVNKLRSHANSEISSLVKKMIKFWKDEVSKEKKNKSRSGSTVDTRSPGESGSGSGATANVAAANVAPTTTTTTTAKSSKFITDKPRNPRNDGINVDVYDHSTRNGSLTGLYTALAIESTEQPSLILDVAKEIEREVFKTEYMAVNDGYRTKLRSLVMNLRNKNNPELRARLLGRVISGARLVSMKPEEIASDQLKKEMEDIHKKNLFDAQGATEKRAVTDRFTCGKCKHKKVSYYQMQTRSADEPLTTFCTCENCGNRWKFS